MMDHEKFSAIVLAGGSGSRMHSDVKKQYMMLNGKPVLAYSLLAFEESNVDDMVVVADESEWNYIRENIIEPLGIRKTVSFAESGCERYHSVYSGLKKCEARYVLIHDGARPLVTPEIIARTMKAAQQNQACVAAMPVKDTIKFADHDGFAAETPDRNLLWQIQTPQAFGYFLIREAYDSLMKDEPAQKGITDDAMVVERMTGQKVKLVEGSYQNIKVTTPEDLIVAEVFLAGKNKMK